MSTVATRKPLRTCVMCRTKPKYFYYLMTKGRHSPLAKIWVCSPSTNIFAVKFPAICIECHISLLGAYELHRRKNPGFYVRYSVERDEAVVEKYDIEAEILAVRLEIEKNQAILDCIANKQFNDIEKIDNLVYKQEIPEPRKIKLGKFQIQITNPAA